MIRRNDKNVPPSSCNGEKEKCGQWRAKGLLWELSKMKFPDRLEYGTLFTDRQARIVMPTCTNKPEITDSFCKKG